MIPFETFCSNYIKKTIIKENSHCTTSIDTILTIFSDNIKAFIYHDGNLKYITGQTHRKYSQFSQMMKCNKLTLSNQLTSVRACISCERDMYFLLLMTPDCVPHGSPSLCSLRDLFAVTCDNLQINCVHRAVFTCSIS